MKILIVTYGLNTVGGVQNWQYQFSHQFIKSGHDVTILELFDFSENYPEKKFLRNWDPRIKLIINNGPVVARGFNPNTSWAAVKVIVDLQSKMKFSRLLRDNKYDAVLFSDPNFTFFFFKASLKANNCFVQFHNSFSRFRSTSRLRYILTKFRARYYKKFIFLSEGDMAAAIEAGFEKSRVGYMSNFINEAPFLAYSKSNFPPKNQILIVGNLDIPEKQVDHALRAFNLIERDVSGSWRIKIVGDGACRERLVRLTTELGIGDQVEFVGIQKEPAFFFFESAFFVLSSSFEGAPLTLLECIFSNLPAVSYNCSPFIPEVIQNGRTGLIVEQNNIQQLSEAMASLMKDPGLLNQMSANMESMKKDFSIESAIKKWEQLLSSSAS